MTNTMFLHREENDTNKTEYKQKHLEMKEISTNRLLPQLYCVSTI